MVYKVIKKSVQNIFRSKTCIKHYHQILQQRYLICKFQWPVFLSNSFQYRTKLMFRGGKTYRTVKTQQCGRYVRHVHVNNDQNWEC